VTPDIALVMAILSVSVVLLVTEWIPMEVTALLAMGSVALTGLVRPVDALAGFSNPAVVTVWAVFILSGGLTRTGVANILGRWVLRMAGKRESTMIVVIMTTAGLLSAVMNNVAVAALMLPVVMDIARHTRRPPSRLLLPLAYGSLLGGLTTQIGTPPNILVTDALHDAGLETFSFFDFTPVGLAILFAGVVFMVFIGRHMLPRRDVVKATAEGRDMDLTSHYALQERMFTIRVPEKSDLIGRTLADIRLGSSLGLNVIGITRHEKTLLSPGPGDMLQAGDLLTVQGRPDAMDQLSRWRELVTEDDAMDIIKPYSDAVRLAELRLSDHSTYSGKTLNQLNFRQRFGANVLALRRNAIIRRSRLQDDTLQSGDWLLIAGPGEKLEAMGDMPGFDRFRFMSRSEVIDTYHLHERLMVLRVPPDAVIVGQTLKESRLGDMLGSRVLGILRGDQPIVMPEPWEVIQIGDRLVVEGRRSDFELLTVLEQLAIDKRSPVDMEALTSGGFGMVEAILSPQSTLEGQTLRQLNFREKYGLTVLALWRKGQAIRAQLRDHSLRFGDAILIHGPHAKLKLLGQEPDFIVLTETAQEPLREEKAAVSTAIMCLTLLPVILGWVPIYIAAVVGAAVMVMAGCLSMEEAYRQIEWKAIFLIAGMLPLGSALDQTGAARYIAVGVVNMVGPYGFKAVMLGLVGLTFLATCFVPTAALVVLMAPIALNTSANLGINPQTLMMAIAMAASASFVTPISHPANILVMGPGGYRFMDYFKVGGTLTLVVLVVIMIVLPLFWPLH
jgi:di/tricarboxylate transporter